VGRRILTGAIALVLSGAAALAAPITAGDLVVVRAAGGPNGDATAALQGSGTAAGTWLDEYTTGGVLVQSILLPTTANATVGGPRALTLSGTANTEGTITLSQNGLFMAVGGYNQTATVAGTNGSASTAVERVVGILNLATGNVDTSTAFVDAMSQQNIRSAYTTDGVNVWVTGNGGNNATVNAVSVPTSGVHYGQLGVNTGGITTSTQLNTTGLTANNRVINVFGFAPRMYVSNGNTSSPAAPARGPDTFQSGGIPTTTGQTLASLPGFPTTAGPAPDDFWFMDDNTVYVADTRTDGVNGGIQKWLFNGGTGQWGLAYTMTGIANGLTTIGGGAAGVHGLTGVINGGVATLYGVTFDGTGANQTKLFSITDTGAASVFNILATSPANTAFRGVDINLLAPIPEPASVISLLGLAGLAFARRSRR
jgi:hypothetical protein